MFLWLKYVFSLDILIPGLLQYDTWMDSHGTEPELGSWASIH